MGIHYVTLIARAGAWRRRENILEQKFFFLDYILSCPYFTMTNHLKLQ
jgi:hypothetical protein